jgi:hypothetical protein
MRNQKEGRSNLRLYSSRQVQAIFLCCRRRFTELGARRLQDMRRMSSGPTFSGITVSPSSSLLKQLWSSPSIPELASRSESARTPWATIGEAPEQFFDLACLPDGFKFQDPSRMGVRIKTLLLHLRERQEQLGVRAFHFHHVLRNNTLEPASYPDSAQSVLDSEDQMDQANVMQVATAKTETTAMVPSPIPPMEEKSHNPVKPLPSAIANERCAPEQHSTSVAPPGWSQLPGPNYCQPYFMSATNSNPMPADPRFPIMYNPHFMPQWGGQPGWGPPPVPPAEQLLRIAEHSGHGFHAPTGAAGPEMPVPPTFRPPSKFIDPHPIPTGDPPYTYIYPPVPFDQRPIDPSVTTPTKKSPSKKTPRKTPGKRKRGEAEDTPSKTPTRASNRTRTPKKMFEINQ